MAFRAWSTAFDEGGVIPARYTGDGEDIAPAIEWAEAPSGTKSFALICDDPDAPNGTWTHWMLWDIPNDTGAIPEGFTPGRLGTSGQNDFGKEGYGGPAPPSGHGVHHYHFKVLALDMKRLPVHHGARREELERALWGHVIEEARVTGTYERK